MSRRLRFCLARMSSTCNRALFICRHGGNITPRVPLYALSLFHLYYGQPRLTNIEQQRIEQRVPNPRTHDTIIRKCHNPPTIARNFHVDTN